MENGRIIEMQIKVHMKINSEKKHSVRYDAVAPDSPVTSIYIMKTGLGNSIPQNIIVTVTEGGE